MSMRAATTELGVVAREISPSGEHAYRRNHDGSWNHSPDHKGPWIVVPSKDVPERFKDAIEDHQREVTDARRAQSADADLDRLEHEQGTTAELWSGDWDAELERLELDPETRGERGRSERPERGIEDDEELER